MVKLAVLLRKDPAGTQVALIHLLVAYANKPVVTWKLKVSWSVRPLGIYEPPET